MREGLEAALAALPEAGFPVLARSRWWRSAAWPDPQEPEFLNAVVIVQAEGEPQDTLRRLKAIEVAFGRRESARNGSRPLDLDLIAWGDAIVSTPQLVLPHPRAAERLFVMAPLAEIAPDWCLPGTAGTATALAAAATVGLDARPTEERGVPSSG